ncbi:glycosyltransferase family 4 protein [Cyclobacterium xiamenense]|uniref:glycosyltransferase family 4 protein n=1 Tax=Cyclobacterium xiamenense TaxID=1297121 RepID=UPI0012B963B4|nr:glycosyltransferase family 4 protein [Cyclobacterium xiamenense]
MKKRKQLVVINQSAGYLMVDTVNAFRDAYHERILICGSVGESFRKLDADVKIDWITRYRRETNLLRLGTWIWGFFQLLVKLGKKYPEADLLIVSNPPFAVLLPLWIRRPYKLLIYDIYPDALVKLGILTPKSWPTHVWERANRRVMQGADRVYTLTESMQQELSRYLPKECITVVPLWASCGISKRDPVGRHNGFLSSFGWEGKFVLMYSGNMGRSHPVRLILQLARNLQHLDDFRFVLIGGGEQYEQLSREIATAGLTNSCILPWQPANRLQETFSAASIALVTIAAEMGRISIPSKTFNFLAHGTPILAVAAPDSGLYRLVEEGVLGGAFQELEIDRMTRFLLTCKNDPAYYQNLQNRCRSAAQKYTYQNANKFLAE